MFYGITRTFSTINEAQYEAIGAFWNEMSEIYGIENLRGLGYSWTPDSIEYAIGLKEGLMDDYNCEICLPIRNWITVKGKTADLGKIYEKTYEDGSLDMEIETFTADGECEISYYRMNDDWMDETIEVRKLVFDTVKCSAYIRPKEPDSIVLISNFSYVTASSIHWMDEASYGMCSHRCTPEEAAEFYELLKESKVEDWRFTGGLRNIPVTKKVKERVLEIFAR